MYFFKIGEFGVIVFITKREIGNKFNQKNKPQQNAQLWYYNKKAFTLLYRLFAYCYDF